MSDMPPPPPPDESEWSSQPPPPPGQPASASPATKGWATFGTGENAELAGAGSRLGARIIDAVILAIVAIVLFIVVAVASFGELVDDDEAVDDDAIEEAFEGLIVVPLVVMAVGMLYEVSLTALKGQTLGKMAVRIRVVSAESGSLPGWGKAFGRWFVPSIVGVIGLWISFVGLLALVIYASLLWDKRRQGWHDKAAKTLVIKA